MLAPQSDERDPDEQGQQAERAGRHHGIRARVGQPSSEMPTPPASATTAW